MSVDTHIEAMRAVLADLGARAEAAQTPPHLRPFCAVSGDYTHIVIHAPGDHDPDPGNRVIVPGFVCLDCCVAFGGGHGLLDLAAAVKA